MTSASMLASSVESFVREATFTASPTAAPMISRAMRMPNGLRLLIPELPSLVHRPGEPYSQRDQDADSRAHCKLERDNRCQMGRCHKTSCDDSCYRSDDSAGQPCRKVCAGYGQRRSSAATAEQGYLSEQQQQSRGGEDGRNGNPREIDSSHLQRFSRAESAQS